MAAASDPVALHALGLSHGREQLPNEMRGVLHRHRHHVLAVGDVALGFWKAIRDVFPDTKEQRCWWHKIGNVLAALPKSAHPAGEEGPGRDLQRREQGGCGQGRRHRRDRVRGEVA
jgi:hypothetical protein